MKVFPTHVGVFLKILHDLLPLTGLPHARGGVSITAPTRYQANTVFPTHVGVFLNS